MNTAELPIIELRGSPRERGRIYGEAAQQPIKEVIDYWRDSLGGAGIATQQNPDSYLQAFLADTNFIPSIERWAPELLEEVRGIAEGAQQDFHTILALQWIDEEWTYGRTHKLERPSTKCTAFAVADGKEGTLAGQTMDVPSWVEGRQVLLRILPDDGAPETLVFSIAGVIGLNGVNASPLGITCNSLPQLSSSSDGLPVAFIVRSILAYRDIDQAEEFLRAIKQASGQNYILSAPNDVRCFECSSTGVIRYMPKDGDRRVFHTNHPLASTDKSDTSELTISQLKNTKARLDSICNRLGDGSQPLNLNDAKAALSAHDDPENPISRRINPTNIGNSIGYTASASIYEFGATPRLHLAAGPPCETAFKVFDFKTTPES